MRVKALPWALIHTVEAWLPWPEAGRDRDEFVRTLAKLRRSRVWHPVRLDS
jgi:hypothetical protein